MSNMLLSGAFLFAFVLGFSRSLTETTSWAAIPCVTEYSPRVLEFTWVLGNLTIRAEGVGQSIQSPEFSLNAAVSRWRLVVFPLGSVEAGPDYLSVFTCLSYAPSNQQVARVHITLEANGRGSDLVRPMSSDHDFTKGECIGWPAFVGRTRLFRDHLKQDDSLHFKVKVTQVMPSRSCLHAAEEIHRLECRRTSWRLETALKKGLYSDSQFQVGSLRLPTHKVVLQARQPGLLERLLKKGKANLVKTKPDSARRFLIYLYTGHLPPVEKISAELIGLAEVMQVTELVIELRKKLIEGLRVDTAAHILDVAEMSNTTEAKDLAMLFVLDNTDQVMTSEGWDMLMKKKPTFIGEVLYELQRLREIRKGGGNVFTEKGARNYTHHVLPVVDDLFYAKDAS